MIIGTGVDITEVRRLRQAVEKWGEAFLNRVFTKKELASARNREGALYQHLAGRFAAKEAVFKALGNSQLTWQDVQIVNDETGRPYCQISASKAKNVDVHISISHVKSYATATAVITQKA